MASRSIMIALVFVLLLAFPQVSAGHQDACAGGTDAANSWQSAYHSTIGFNGCEGVLLSASDGEDWYSLPVKLADTSNTLTATVCFTESTTSWADIRVGLYYQVPGLGPSYQTGGVVSFDECEDIQYTRSSTGVETWFVRIHDGSGGSSDTKVYTLKTAQT